MERLQRLCAARGIWGLGRQGTSVVVLAIYTTLALRIGAGALAVGLLALGAQGAPADQSVTVRACHDKDAPGHNPWPAAEQQLAPVGANEIQLCRFSSNSITRRTCCSACG